MATPQPRRPEHLPDYSETCLQALVEHGLAENISLGGALGLLHYLDYRATHDVDAWWTDTAAEADRRQVLHVLESVLCQAGLLTPGDCWRLWQRRQAAAGGSADVERATLAVQTHLARIAQHRRLDHIADSTQQQQAEAVRAWYVGAFLDAAG